MSLSSSFVFNWAHKQSKKKWRFWEGLVTGQNIGSLLLFFAYGGLLRGKKFLRIWTGASVKTKCILYFWWEEINYTLQDFSRQKTLYIFWSTLDTIQKRRPFFSRDIFPPKDLIFFENIFQFSEPFQKNVSTTEGINLSFSFLRTCGLPPQKREFLLLRKYCFFSFGVTNFVNGCLYARITINFISST